MCRFPSTPVHSQSNQHGNPTNASRHLVVQNNFSASRFSATNTGQRLSSSNQLLRSSSSATPSELSKAASSSSQSNPIERLTSPSTSSSSSTVSLPRTSSEPATHQSNSTTVIAPNTDVFLPGPAPPPTSSNSSLSMITRGDRSSATLSAADSVGLPQTKPNPTSLHGRTLGSNCSTGFAVPKPRISRGNMSRQSQRTPTVPITISSNSRFDHEKTITDTEFNEIQFYSHSRMVCIKFVFSGYVL